MARCRSCGASITWAWTLNGKRMPIDAEPVEDGNLEIAARNDEGEPVVRYLSGGDRNPLPGFDLVPRYVSHFATCPNAQDHRKK